MDSPIPVRAFCILPMLAFLLVSISVTSTSRVERAVMTPGARDERSPTCYAGLGSALPTYLNIDPQVYEDDRG